MNEPKSLIVSIGNTDNKLTQKRWSAFVEEIDHIIRTCAVQIYFFGGSSTWEPWQNVLWHFDFNTAQDYTLTSFLRHIEVLRKKYLQDGIYVASAISLPTSNIGEL